MLRIGTVVLTVGDLRSALDFWCEAPGYAPRAGEPEADDDFMVLVAPGGRNTALALDTSESSVQLHPRVHLDLHADSPEEQAREVERLVALGAER